MRSARRPIRALVLAAALLASCTAVPLPHEGTYHASDADLAVTRIVHGSLALEIAKTTLLVDPWFHSTFATRQTEPIGLTPDRLPPSAAVLITHRHAGHFDPEALAEIAKTTPRAIAPPPLADRLRALGFRDVTALDWWDDTTVGPIRVTAVPADHTVRENGYVLASDRVRVYVGGDTRWFGGLVDVATAFPDLDVAFLPIGGERIMGFPRTMGPGEAAKAAALLKPRRIVPIGYAAAGGFPLVWYAGDPVTRFRDAARDEGLAPERIVVLEPGESWHYYR
jgi:L-ascorbate metabolism protein UlaG (beta-lactamase superfamily)